MPRGSQLARQWRLLQLLDAPAGVTVEDAARDLDCAVRTIWRDLRVLENAGHGRCRVALPRATVGSASQR